MNMTDYIFFRWLSTTTENDITCKHRTCWTCLLFLRTCRMELSAEWPSDDNWH